MDRVSRLLLSLQVVLVCSEASSLAAEMEALKEAHGAVTASGRPHAVIFATQRVRPRVPSPCRNPPMHRVFSLPPIRTILVCLTN